ncbi:MAG: RNA polymerase sigma-54 factor [Rhodospirillaceae bacterium]|nr:MAG: RNA polymerase sigma-54 factor [Rhodospirillaceae bacterium]
MALSPRLDLRQSQSLVITPQLQQAIKLLQLSSVELDAYIAQELDANPLLEVDDSGDGSALAESAGNSDERVGDEAVLVDAVDGQDERPLDIAQDVVDNDPALSDDGLDALAPADTVGAMADTWSGAGGFEGAAPDFDRNVAEAPDLRSHLLQQLNLSIHTPAERFIGLFLIDQLDESGYLAIDLEEAAEHLGTDAATVLGVLKQLQRFDPPGLFARDLRECLRLQLEDRNRYDPAMAALIDRLDLLAARDMRKLRDICGVSAEDLRDMVAEIRALDPKPALKFERAIEQTVVPDVIMTVQQGGGWRIELNPQCLPRVLVNHGYYAEVCRNGSKADKSFMSDRLQTANWLVKALNQRAETILKVAIELVKQQTAFFHHGISHLRPLVLRDVAEAIEMHESTVSRVTTNKYIATPRGVFELKYFFTQGLPSSSGAEAHSAASVRHRIKVLIDGEPPTGILSDDRIVELLHGEGIEVARRTVAKYRDALNIPSSARRRREKMAEHQGH